MPAVGDIVLVSVNPDENNGSDVVPAMVTRVYPLTAATDTDPEIPEHVSLRVLHDGYQNPTPRWGVQAAAGDDLSAVDSSERELYYANRPGQAPAASLTK